VEVFNLIGLPAPKTVGQRLISDAYRAPAPRAEVQMIEAPAEGSGLGRGYRIGDAMLCRRTRQTPNTLNVAA
jgi:hypothetical protein